MVNFDKFLASFITEIKKYQPVTSYNIPACIKKALKDQEFEYKDGEIVKTQDIIATESEDEKIRKSLLMWVQSNSYTNIAGIQINDVIDWLEKQGKETSYKPSKEDDVRRRSTIQVLEYARSLDTYNQYGKADIDKNIAWLEEQGNPNKDYWKSYKDGKKSILDRYSELKIQDKQKPNVIIPKFKIGDEVITENEGSLTITRIDEEGYWSNDLFICDFDSECVWDLVEQKPYGQRKECLDCQFNYAGECKGSCQMKRSEQESTWSEEDESMYTRTLGILGKCYMGQLPDKVEEELKWLKSIRHQKQWKPSKEQLHLLHWIANVKLGDSVVEQEVSKHLNGLYEDLKKL